MHRAITRVKRSDPQILKRLELDILRTNAGRRADPFCPNGRGGSRAGRFTSCAAAVSEFAVRPIRNDKKQLRISETCYRSHVLAKKFSGRAYIPPPPPHFWQKARAREEGVYFFEAPRGQDFLPPPFPPPLEGIFRNGGGSV